MEGGGEPQHDDGEIGLNVVSGVAGDWLKLRMGAEVAEATGASTDDCAEMESARENLPEVDWQQDFFAGAC